ncbi:MAG: hypothetical protein ACE37K_19805 [Planctomycetota bacterium]
MPQHGVAVSQHDEAWASALPSSRLPASQQPSSQQPSSQQAGSQTSQQGSGQQPGGQQPLLSAVVGVRNRQKIQGRNDCIIAVMQG